MSDDNEEPVFPHLIKFTEQLFPTVISTIMDAMAVNSNRTSVLNKPQDFCMVIRGFSNYMN